MSCTIEVLASSMAPSYVDKFSGVSIDEIEQCGDSNNNNLSGMSPPTPQKRQRRVSSALYEVRRKDLDDVLYLYVPDEYDLVKSHLMFAVREEVEVLKEKIAELMERISQLEYENTILKANASPDTLNQLAQQPKPPTQQQGTTNTNSSAPATNAGSNVPSTTTPSS